MFDLGTQELIVIFVVALLVFGPKRLPELARALGKGMRELKTAMRGVKETLEEAEAEVSKEVGEVKTGIEEHLIKGSPVSFYGDETDGKEKGDTGPGAERDRGPGDDKEERKREGSGTDTDG